LRAASSQKFFGKGVTDERANTSGANVRAFHQMTMDRNSCSDANDQSRQLKHAAASETTLHDLNGDECQMVLPLRTLSARLVFFEDQRHPYFGSLWRAPRN